MMKENKKMLVNTLCAALVFSIMAFGMTGCGNKQQDNEEQISDVNEAADIDEDEDDVQADEDDVQANENDLRVDENDNDVSEEESISAGDSCDIVVGSGTITIDVPSNAENVQSGPYLLTYDQGNIDVEYSDSFCKLTDDAIEELVDLYDIWASQSDTLSNIEPVETKVGERDAYYCRAVDSTNYVCYIFFVDIGEKNYLDVTILGPGDELSEEKAFELADLEFR
ncbi:MAG: hypothetical protein HDR00_02560 [Lachnospiraceae bacterium]|nr:hypothetical protein [Lachnospiraceae bacterium]